jgi:2-hydroxymuconate-semialdehyde hydrolase
MNNERGNEMFYQIKTLNTNGFNTNYLEAGEQNGETILFLHGSGPGASAESNWKNILPVLAEKYHVIAPDMIGFGKTDHPTDPPKNFWEWTNVRVEQVLSLLEQLRIDRVNLVGNSMGGFVSLNIVMTAPERVHKVLLMGSAGGAAEPTPEIGRMIGFYKNPTYENLKNLTTWFVYDEEKLGDELDSILTQRYEEVMRPEVRQSYVSNMFPQGPGENIIPPSALRKMRQPFMLLHGYEDRFVKKESSLSLMEHLPNAELHLFKGCGHWVQIEKRDEFLNRCKSFF